MKVIKITERETKTGLKFRDVTVLNEESKEETVAFWGKNEIKEGEDIDASIELNDKGFKNLKMKYQPKKGGTNPMIKEAQETKRKDIQDAQYRKEISIAYFNSINSAISLLGKVDPELSPQEFIDKWSSFFINRHKEHRLNELSRITETSVAKSVDLAKEKLDRCQDNKDLAKVFMSLNVDEQNRLRGHANTLREKLKAKT